MTARSADDAADALVANVRAIARCITDRPIVTITERRPERIVRLTFGPASQPVALRSSIGNHHIGLAINEEYILERASGSANLRRRAYYYRILDRDEREILAYHWHPHGRSAVAAPHMHLSYQIQPLDLGSGSAPVPWADLHIATGAVALADIVAMLIDDFRIDPLVDDWRAKLARRAG